ncbi:flavodoxin family protein [Streptomyces roseoverticillatus]|uniref:flavodoxin family protein n=1 Tax=Streptomyces roseoverticillatus TaxID=66429 RepID=UPI001F2EE202|nr:flavodoxin family protein [Streptomyces roseoverticillatus]MCF3102199.1 flavodoxin family protein [Streptomyces roseoverticillatus]
MKAVIVCTSVSHGNTKRIADVMGQVLEASVVDPDQADMAELSTCDLVGFGSGIFLGKFHPRLRQFVRSLPQVERRGAFVFATSGLPEPRLRPFTRPLVRVLAQKGWEVNDTFSCRGFDTWLPFKLVGGINKGRPGAPDLEAARTFAEGLRARTGAVS